MSSSKLKLLPATVVIPVKNEEANLERCLKRLSRFAEVVVIDSGSTDRTLDIALAHGARIVDFQWNGQYPKKRNWFLLNDGPKMPWVLFLDADELVSDTFCDEVAEVVSKDDDKKGFWLTYTNYFLGVPLKYGLSQRKLAFFRTGTAFYERIDEDGWSSLDMEVHEHPIVDGAIGEITVPIDHRDYKGLGKFIEKHREYALWEARRFTKLAESSFTWDSFTPRQRFKYRHLAKWWYPWFYFVFSYFIMRGFLDGAPGFYYAAYKAGYFQTIRLLIKEQSNSNPTQNF